MQKRLLVIILAAVTAFGVTACSLPFSAASEEEEDTRPERKKAELGKDGKTTIDLLGKLGGGEKTDSTSTEIFTTDPDPEPEPDPVDPEPIDPASQPAYDSDFAFMVYDVDGNFVDLADVMSKSELTMVNVWASWCGPCVGELQEIDALSQKYKDDGLTVVGILYDSEDVYYTDGTGGFEDGKTIIDYYGLTYTNLRKPGGFDYVYNLEYFPTTFFLDSEGNFVCDEVIGADPESYEKIIKDRLGY